MLCVGAALAVIYLASLLSWVVFTGRRPLQPWGPYVTVVTDREPARAAALLTAAGARDVITELTSEVLVTRFSRLEALPLAAALEQLDPMDPRRDPFMTSLTAYFRLPEPDNRHLLYARFDAPLWRAQRMTRRALGGDARVAEWAVVRVIASLVIYLGFCAVLVVAARRHRLAAAAGYLVWLPAVASAGLQGVAAILLVAVSWTWSLHDLARLQEAGATASRISIRMLASSIWFGAVAMGSLAIVRRIAGGPVMVFYLAALAGTAAVTAAVLYVARYRAAYGDHELFVPVSILPGRTPFSGRRPLRMSALPLAALAAALVVLPPLAHRFLPRFAAPAPMPVPVAGAVDYSPESLEVLWNADQPGSLPDISDYLAHRAYQEGLTYGREYGFPASGERVTISRFSVNEDGTYSRFGEDVLVFDTGWREHAIATAPAGITRLLALFSRPSGVVLSPEPGLYSDHPLLWQHTAYVVLVLVPVFVGMNRPLPLRWKRSRVAEIAGRRRQVA